jgi:hypothetical protein
VTVSARRRERCGRTLDELDETGGSHDDVVLDPSVVVGTWANSSCVHRGRDELTIDFLRRVPEIVRRIEARKIREYYEKRKRAP